MLSILVRRNVVLSLCLLGTLSSLAQATQSDSKSLNSKQSSKLNLGQALQIALQQDQWQSSSLSQQEALHERAIAAGELPDTRLSLNVANLATDTLRFNQERMTQLQFGISQTFPRGDTLVLRRARGELLSESQPIQRQLRAAKIGLTVTTLWLDAHQVRESIALINRNKPLFDQLSELALASYSSVTANTRQQDIVRAQLERTLLDDRLSILKQRLVKLEQQLTGWLIAADGTWRKPSGERIYDKKLPTIALLQSTQIQPSFLHHPMVEVLDKTIAAQKVNINLERQALKPKWNAKLGYSYRDSDPNGVKRTDLVTFGVSVDLPLFSRARPRSNIRAAALERDASLSDRLLLLRDLNTKFNALKVQQRQLATRAKLYRNEVLVQMKRQTQASLNAYTADNGDFTDVVRARIAQLNGRIDTLEISVDQQKLNAQMNYLLATTQVPVYFPGQKNNANVSTKKVK